MHGGKDASVEAYRTLGVCLTNRIENESEAIVFTAPDGVADVASAAKNHAIAMAEINRKVLVIDAKSRDKQLTRKMKMEMAEGFSEWLQGDANLEEEIRKIWMDTLKSCPQARSNSKRGY